MATRTVTVNITKDYYKSISINVEVPIEVDNVSEFLDQDQDYLDRVERALDNCSFYENGGDIDIEED